MDHKKQLKNIVDSIGGIITDCYDDNCTHLTATTATTTNKVSFFNKTFLYFYYLLLLIIYI